MEIIFGDPPKSTYLVDNMNRINTLKMQIEQDEECWDEAKKYTNPCERVHVFRSSDLAPSVARIYPVSRSFFKLVELSERFK